ncbi:MAG: hypothetical protein KC731_42765, partial [Myxococcales bacterium]|nr:hypothetical protein [Myxococcales bacterium]
MSHAARQRSLSLAALLGSFAIAGATIAAAGCSDGPTYINEKPPGAGGYDPVGAGGSWGTGYGAGYGTGGGG